MEQIKFLLEEYYSWISLAGCALTLILLAVALHRIRKLKKQIREMEGKAGRILECVEYTAEAHRREAEELAFRKRPKMMDEDCQAEGYGTGAGRPEELINAVLEEVFP